MEADILQLAARAYQKLMTVEYQVVLGRKGKAHTIEIAFRADNFYHLAGLHNWIVTKRNSFCMIEERYLLPLKLWQIIWQRDT